MEEVVYESACGWLSSPTSSRIVYRREMHARDGQPKRLFSECRVSIGVKNEGRIEQNIFPIQLVGLGGVAQIFGQP